jgi:hypothetical protein
VVATSDNRIRSVAAAARSLMVIRARIRGNQMTETMLRPTRHALAAGDGANATDSSKSRLAMRLWTLLHAQALLQGTIGGAGGVLNAEDDRWRLAARRETTHQR